MKGIRWERFPLITQSSAAKAWLAIQNNIGLAANTVEAYGRALEDYLGFCGRWSVMPEAAKREHLARYVHELVERPNPSMEAGHPRLRRRPQAGLANATLQQRLTVLRLYYDYLREEGIRVDNPVGRGRYVVGRVFSGHSDRGLIPRYRKLPWIPTDQEWQVVLQSARAEPIRNRTMMAFAYDAALRREELCALATGDIDPACRLIRVRAETTKNRQERVVPYLPATETLYRAYLHHRETVSRARGPLFLSESRRNRARPISIWTWSKVVARIAARSGLLEFTTHTFRHYVPFRTMSGNLEPSRI
jgi:integrase/recombinase XerD